MGTWSTTAPSGVSWSDWLYSNVKKPTAYQFRTASRIARGQNNTIYVHVRMQAQCYDYNASPASVGLHAEVSVGNTTSYSASSKYTASVSYGTSVWTTVKDVYYTDTANNGTYVYAKTYATGSYITGANKHTAPDYTTTYTVSYNKNNSSATGTTASQTKTYGHSLTLRTNGFSLAGHAFSGWNTKADGTGTAYAGGGTYTANAAVTLYAQWVTNTYTVSYNANGGSGTTASQTKTYGTDLTLRENGFTRENYVFVEWNTAADGSGTAYEEGGTYSENAAATLYAIWTLETYEITYDSNDAAGYVSPQTKTYGAPLVLRQNEFIKQGYAFTEWNTEPEGGGTSYAAGATYTANRAVTLYAQWEKANVPAYVNVKVGGVNMVRQVEKVCANVKINGVNTIVECDVYANIGGEIVPIM